MFTKILGILWIMLGLLWLIKPQGLKNRLTRKMNRKLKWVVYGFVVLFGLLVVGSVIKAEGLLPKIVGVIGIIITVKGIFLLTSKAQEKVSTWWSARPLIFFRIIGGFFFATGAMSLFIRK